MPDEQNNGEQNQTQTNGQQVQADDGKTIPKYRFDEVIAERDRYKKQATDKQATWESARVSELEAKLEEQASLFGRKESRWEREKTMIGAGLTDPEAQGVAAYLYENLQPPEGKEKPAFADWLKFEGEDVAPPRALQPYLSRADKAETTETRRTNVNEGATGRKPATGTLTNDRIKGMREEAQRTGDWSAYKEARKSLFGLD